jgi:hypothetical protein
MRGIEVGRQGDEQMMREVIGAFHGSRKLDEALEDLRAEGIAADRVRVASMSGFADFHASQIQSNNAQTQWIAAEYAGHGEHLGVVDTTRTGWTLRAMTSFPRSARMAATRTSLAVSHA